MRVLLPGRDYFPPRVLLRGDRPALAALRAGRGDGGKEPGREEGLMKGEALPRPVEAAVLPRGAGAALGGPSA